MKSIHQFQTDRLLVRPLVESDYTEWRRANRNALARQNEFDQVLSEGALSHENFQSILECDRRFIESDLTYSFSGFSLDTGKIIGGTQVWCVQRGECQRGTLGFWVFNNYWGNGYGSELASAMIAYAFTHLKLNRLEAELLPENTASERICRNAGMTCEGIRRQALAVQGSFRDHLVFSIIADDFSQFRYPGI